MKEVFSMAIFNKEEGSKIILTDHKLIIKKGIIKKTFKRRKIKSIKITEDFKISILYGNNIYSIIIDRINEEELQRIKEIFDVLNKEKILFYSEDNRVKEKSYIFICILFWGLSIYFICYRIRVFYWFFIY